jgi:CHAT domain-containing protein
VNLAPLSAVEADCEDLTFRPTAAADTLVTSLRKRLVEPLGLSASTRRVLVSPSGVLSYVPFGLLLPDREVVCLPSGTTYGVLREDRSKRGEAVLAIGDPAYSGSRGQSPSAVYLRGRGLPALPATAAEARAVGDVILLAGAATEAAIWKAVEGRKRWRAAHFACHGTIDPERPLLSSLAVTEDEEDDGFLTAAEVLRQELPADLVVLSACETAKGKVFGGEGIVGLTRAFMFAGAPRVICSLWKVDDEATRALMVEFYRLWNPKDGSKPMGTAAALRAAQEYVRTHEIDVPDDDASKKTGKPFTKRVRHWEHPYYWAAWVLWGLAD